VTSGEWASDRQSTNPDRQVPGDTSAREEEKRRGGGQQFCQEWFRPRWIELITVKYYYLAENKFQ